MTMSTSDAMAAAAAPSNNNKLPLVKVTPPPPPPPPPPPSPFLLSPPPPSYPLPPGAAVTQRRKRPGSAPEDDRDYTLTFQREICVSFNEFEPKETAAMQRKQKQVRFKLDRESPQEAIKKTCRPTATELVALGQELQGGGEGGGEGKNSCDVMEPRASSRDYTLQIVSPESFGTSGATDKTGDNNRVVTTSAKGRSGRRDHVTTKNDDKNRVISTFAKASPQERPRALDRLKRILGRFSALAAFSSSRAETPYCTQVSVRDREGTCSTTGGEEEACLSRPVPNRHLSRGEDSCLPRSVQESHHLPEEAPRKSKACNTDNNHPDLENHCMHRRTLPMPDKKGDNGSSAIESKHLMPRSSMPTINAGSNSKGRVGSESEPRCVSFSSSCNPRPPSSQITGGSWRPNQFDTRSTLNDPDPSSCSSFDPRPHSSSWASGRSSSNNTRPHSSQVTGGDGRPNRYHMCVVDDPGYSTLPSFKPRPHSRSHSSGGSASRRPNQNEMCVVNEPGSGLKSLLNPRPHSSFHPSGASVTGRPNQYQMCVVNDPGSGSSSSFKPRPHSSSQASGGSASGQPDQYQRHLVNMQLYRMASRQQRQLRDDLSKNQPAGYVPTIQVECPAHDDRSEERGDSRGADHHYRRNETDDIGWGSKHGLPVADDDRVSETHKVDFFKRLPASSDHHHRGSSKLRLRVADTGDSSAVTIRSTSSRYGEFTFESLSPGDRVKGHRHASLSVVSHSSPARSSDCKSFRNGEEASTLPKAGRSSDTPSYWSPSQSSTSDTGLHSGEAATSGVKARRLSDASPAESTGNSFHSREAASSGVRGRRSADASPVGLTRNDLTLNSGEAATNAGKARRSADASPVGLTRNDLTLNSGEAATNAGKARRSADASPVGLTRNDLTLNSGEAATNAGKARRSSDASSAESTCNGRISGEEAPSLPKATRCSDASRGSPTYLSTCNCLHLGQDLLEEGTGVPAKATRRSSDTPLSAQSEDVDSEVVGCALNAVRISGRSIHLSSPGPLGREAGSCPDAMVTNTSYATMGSSSRGGSPQPPPSNGFARLDMATLAKLGWSCPQHNGLRGGQIQRNYGYRSAPPRNAGTVALRQANHEDKPMETEYRVSKLQFRRLTDQVRDADSVIRKNRFRGKPAAEKVYRLTAETTPDPATQALRDELQASRSPFTARQWRPLTPDEPETPTVVRCRPVGSRPTTAHGSHSAHVLPTAPGRTAMAPQRQDRPHSTPVQALRARHVFTHPTAQPEQAQAGGHYPRPPDTPRVEAGRFDTLSPRILSQLLTDVQPRPASASYGDRILTTRPRRPPRGKRPERPAGNDSPLFFRDDVSTTSGIYSDVDEDGNNASDDEDGSNNNNDDDGDGDSSDSENGGFEPSLDEVRRQMPHPQSVFRLRPEKLDALYVPDDKRDMRRFEFDGDKAQPPPYPFQAPLPEGLGKLNLRLCAREGSDWRDYIGSSSSSCPMPKEPALKAMLDRLVDLERCQLVTEDWEARKLRGQQRRQAKAAAEAAAALNNGSSGRATSGRFRADKRCCGMCLQAACVGDCPEKHHHQQQQMQPRTGHGSSSSGSSATNRCDKCHQPLCTGACQDSRYDQRMRCARSSENLNLEDRPPPPPPPRSPSRGCHSCLRRHNAKLINANHLVQGRPRSSLATYSRGKSSYRPAKDLRPASAAAMHSSLVKNFERMGIDPHQPSSAPCPPSSSTASSYSRPGSRSRSRNGLLPGKSSRSNRKNSLTRERKRKGRSGGRNSKAAHSVS